MCLMCMMNNREGPQAREPSTGATEEGLTSRGGRNLRLPLRQDIRVATREDSRVLCFPSRRGLTPRGILECNPETLSRLGAELELRRSGSSLGPSQ